MLLWLFKLFRVRKTLWHKLHTALLSGCKCCCSLWRFKVSLVLSNLPHTSHRWHAVSGNGSDIRLPVVPLLLPPLPLPSFLPAPQWPPLFTPPVCKREKENRDNSDRRNMFFFFLIWCCETSLCHQHQSWSARHKIYKKKKNKQPDNGSKFSTQVNHSVFFILFYKILFAVLNK